MNNPELSRRNTLKLLGLGSSAGALSLFGGLSTAEAREQQGTPQYAKGLSPVKIKR